MALAVKERVSAELAASEQDPANYAARPIRGVFKYAGIGVAFVLSSGIVNFAADSYREGVRTAMEDPSMSPAKAAKNILSILPGMTFDGQNFEVNFPSFSVNNPVDSDASEGNIVSELPACPTNVEPIDLLGGYVSTAVYSANSSHLESLGGNELALDPLWINYFAQDNGGMDPNNPTSQNVNIRVLESTDSCEIR